MPFPPERFRPRVGCRKDSFTKTEMQVPASIFSIAAKLLGKRAMCGAMCGVPPVCYRPSWADVWGEWRSRKDQWDIAYSQFPAVNRRDMALRCARAPLNCLLFHRRATSWPRIFPVLPLVRTLTRDSPARVTLHSILAGRESGAPPCGRVKKSEGRPGGRVGVAESTELYRSASWRTPTTQWKYDVVVRVHYVDGVWCAFVLCALLWCWAGRRDI